MHLKKGAEVFGFMRKNDDLIVLNQKLGRLLNDYCYSEVGEEKQRSESRVRLGLPCVLFLFQEANQPQCYAVGVTSDISLHGVSLIVSEKLDTVDYVLVLGPKDKRIYLKVSCKRCEPSDFGTFTVGIEFTKVLSPNDYPAIVKAVSTIEAPPAATPVPILTQGAAFSPLVMV